VKQPAMLHYAGVDWATRTHAVCVVDAFLTQADLAEATRREYGKYLSRLATRLGADRPLATITADELEAAITDLWGATKPRTWNQRLAVVDSFLAFVRWRGWPMAPASDLTLNLDRRRVKVDRTRVPTPTELERFWAKQHIPLMVKVFTRLQYETAARATELLSADIADLNMDNRRLRVTSKGGDIEWVYFQSGSARNLPGCCAGAPAGRCSSPACGPAPPARYRRRLPATGRVRSATGAWPSWSSSTRGGRPTPSARRSSIILAPRATAMPRCRRSRATRAAGRWSPASTSPTSWRRRSPPRPTRTGGAADATGVATR
jgi:integrase